MRAAVWDERKPLLLVSNAAMPFEADLGPTPNLDYRELAAALGSAPLSFAPPRRGIIAAVEARTASDIRQAIDAFRKRSRYSAFVSMSEKVALPLALLLGRSPKRIPHILFAHHLTSERKRALQRRIGYLHRFNRIVVLCREQERYLIEDAGIVPDRVRFVYYMVDHQFWRPSAIGKKRLEKTVLAVGRERRDYETLRLAARLLPEWKITIVASSPWARSGGEAESGQPTDNIEIRRNLPYSELRALYEAATAIVVPLERGTSYAAGVNGVLEAMAMAKAPIVTRTPGILDYVDDGKTGTLIAPNDPSAMARAIEETWTKPDDATRRGAAARAVVDDGRNLDIYVANMAHIVGEVTHGG